MKNRVRVFDNVFTAEEIAELNNYYADKEYTVTKFESSGQLKYKNKNNDYNIVDSTPYNIINKKLTEAIGSHQMQYGAYLESHYPFLPHIDTNELFNENNLYHHSDTFYNNLAVLIPLSEHKDFNTIFWKYWSDKYHTGYDLPIQTEVPVDFGYMLDHVSPTEKLKLERLELDTIYNWKVGGLIVWERNQLHSSSDFSKSKLQKTAITIFL